MSDDLGSEFSDKILKNGELIDPADIVNAAENKPAKEVDVEKESERADDFND